MPSTETPFFSRQCPKCGGHVEDVAPIWKFGASFQCSQCGTSLVAKTKWRMLLGLVYGLIAAWFAQFALRWAEVNLEPNSITLRLATAAVCFAVAVPAMLLLFKGVVYVPKPAEATSRSDA